MNENRAGTYDDTRKGVIRRLFLVYKERQTVNSDCITESTQPDASSPIQDISDIHVKFTSSECILAREE